MTSISQSCSLLLCLSFAATPALRADDALNFNRDIRPILSENCLACHGQDAKERKAGLRLDERAVAIESGAVVPRDVAASPLVKRIFSDDPDELMPPPDSNRQLSTAQKELLKRWVAEGAEYARHWAFIVPVRPVEPSVAQESWARNPIDRFVLGKLEEEGLKPSPEADRATLIKRLSIDLTGLPPTPEEVDAFLSDPSENAYERLVDRLLDSEHYGERMAIAWLDAARYADSNGFQQDGDHWQWIWRDWLIDALNRDLPFDEFTTWQLAGDLLPEASTEQKIASAFNRNHLLNGEGGAIPEEQRFVNLFDRIDTTATTWLGLTMACAQCHDHKYDPITQRDYYSLLDGFNRVPESGRPKYFSGRIRLAPPFIKLPTEENKKRIAEWEARIEEAEIPAKAAADAAFEGWRSGLFADGKPDDAKELSEALLAILEKPEGERTEAEKTKIEPELRKIFDEKVRPEIASKISALRTLDELRGQLNGYRNDQLPRLMIMSDEKPRDTHILSRGEYLKPLEKVSFSTPAFLPPLPEGAPTNRLGFARWLMAPEQPLTARVQVNRMWQHFFGAGIVKTAEDFGVQSEYPVHGELLDWLAVEFRERDWGVKSMHRLIVSSATYRQSSRFTEELRRRDPENRLYARASRFRMPAMILRDWALGASGLLNVKIGGQPVYPYQPASIWDGLAITKERDFTYPMSAGEDLYRRSVYTFWRRTVSPANMFDAAKRQTCSVRINRTNTPLHALTTLNDPTWVEAARVLAEKSLKNAQGLDARLSHAFLRVLCRPPRDRDMDILRRAFRTQLSFFEMDEESARALLGVGASTRDESLNAGEHAALTAVCLAILNFDEALTRE
jgi:hypothetical protein